MVPTKSRPAYENVYSQFRSWMKEKKIASVSEKVILAYLRQKSKMGKPSLVWSYFSMLNSMLMQRAEVDVMCVNQERIEIRESSTKQEISQPAGVGGIHVHGYANCTINIYHGGT